MTEPVSLAPGYLVHHEGLGVGLVLSVEGTGPNTIAHIEFSGNRVWVVVANTPLTIVHKGLEE